MTAATFPDPAESGRVQRATEQRILAQRDAAIALNQRETLHSGDLGAAVRDITEVAARTLGVARVSVWRYNTARDAIQCLDLYELATDRHSSGFELSRADHPDYFAAIEIHDVLAAHDARVDPSTRAMNAGYLAPLGITSMMDASFRVGGVVDGVLCHEHIGPPRAWTADEQSFAVAIAGTVARAIEAAARLRTQAELHASRRRVEDIVNSVDGIVWEAEAGTLRFTFVSRQAERILGYPVTGWKEQPDFWRDHIHPEDRDLAVAQCAAAVAEMQPHEFEYRMIAVDGREVWLKDFVTVIQAADGLTLRGIMVDITRQRQLEEQLRQSQKMEAVGQLAGGVAHDFNNILTVIQSYTSMLLHERAAAGEADEPLQQIALAAERAARLTRQLLAFSRRQVMSPTAVDINAVIDAMLVLLRRTVGETVELTVEPARDLPFVNADVGMLEQVLLNLTLNARDAMPDGGRIIIATNIEKIGAEEAEREPDALAGTFVCLRVTDSGVGIAPDVLPRLFEPFFTTKEVGKGTGLGLPTVYGMVHQHQGWISVRSRQGEGSSFSIHLPVCTSPTPVPETVRPQGAGHSGNETVLVVEDEEPVRRMVRRALERFGYSVMDAADGQAALAIWRANQASIDLVLTDMVMPGGMSGLDLTRAIRAQDPYARIILTSGYSQDVLGKEPPQSNGLGFLPKPYQVRQLLDAVRERLDHAAAG